MALAFDANYYLSTRPDVFNAFVATAGATGQTWAQFASAHYNNFGRFEGSNPNSTFNTREYLSANPDVAAAGVNPFTHFLNFGAKEGRAPSASFPSFASFDEKAYLAANADLGTAGITTKGAAYEHFVKFGQFEGRPGAPAVDTGVPGQTFTLTNNVDGPNAIAPALNTDGSEIGDTYIGTFGAANGDFINGKGGADALKLVGNGTAVVVTTSVERIEGNSQGGAATFTLPGSAGITTLASAGSSSDLTFKGLAALVDTVEVTNTSNGANVTVTYDGSAVAGAADKQKIVLNNAGSSTAMGTVDVDGIETFDVVATGTNVLGGLTGSAVLSTVNVTGAGSFRVNTDFANTVKTFDASAVAGAVRVGFAGGDDVSVKTGAGNDRVDMNAGLTSKDSIDLGEGTDTLVLAGADIRASSNEQLKGVNASKGVDVLLFDGAGPARIDQNTLTLASLSKITFDTTGGADTVDNAKTTLFAFGSANEGNATFALAGTNTTLNLALEGSAKTVASAFNDADVATLNTGAALTVNVSSTGTNDAPTFTGALADGDFNDIGTITAAANATVNLTGDAATNIGGSTNAINLQAGAYAGTLVATGSAGDDILVGGTVKNLLTGAGGIDQIDITKSGAGDIINLANITASVDRDVVTGFQAGASGDIVRLETDETTATTAVASAIAIQEVTSNTGTVNFLTGANDLLELNFGLAGNTLAGSADGTALLAAIGTLSVAADTNTGFIVAYQNGNAFLYHVAEGVDADTGAVAAADIALIGTFNGVAVGALDASNFELV